MYSGRWLVINRASSCLQLEQFLYWSLRREENGKRGIDKKSSNGDVLVFTFNHDSDAIHPGYPRYAEHTELLQAELEGGEFVFAGLSPAFLPLI